MLKEIQRQRNIIFNVIQTLNDEYKNANLTAQYAVGDTGIMLAVKSNACQLVCVLIDTIPLKTYKELYARVYTVIRNGIIQRLRSVQS